MVYYNMHMTQKSKNTLKQNICWVFVFLYIAWIFSNSLSEGTLSSAESGTVTRFLLGILGKFGITLPYDLFHHFVRKLAHFSEYALLGLLTCIAIQKKPLMKSPKVNWLLLGILPPLLDETIQLFVPGRSGALKDSLLDMSGFLFGSLFFLFCTFIYTHFRKKHTIPQVL